MDCRAIGSKDSVIEVIDIRERENVFSLVGHQGEVTFVSFDPKGEYLSSVSVDGTLRIWNLTKKSCESSKPGLSKELCTSDELQLVRIRRSSCHSIWKRDPIHSSQFC